MHRFALPTGYALSHCVKSAYLGGRLQNYVIYKTLCFNTNKIALKSKIFACALLCTYFIQGKITKKVYKMIKHTNVITALDVLL